MTFLQDNEIVNRLKSKNSEFYHSICEVYHFCERVLGQIPKEFSNYTLHDIGHACRVTNYMTDFLKNDLEGYSDLHLAMVVFAGLLHDTGMFVSDDEIAVLKKDVTDIQNYVREHHSERVKKVLGTEISKGRTLNSIFQVDYDYFYDNDLAQICESHTKSCSWIRKNIRSQLVLGNYEANPQQIALLLRIGDNLDIDNRRAPGFLANLLNVEGFSKEEWNKHLCITNYDKVKKASDFSGYTVHFEGRCHDPFYYRKVCDHINWVEQDYKDIIELLNTYPERYNFKLNPKIENNIETIGFECTDIVFRLDYKKIVKLLMGENIYESKQAGMRELIQNSIDAVRIMAEQIRKMPDPYEYRPTVKIILNENTNELIVSDNGIGMTEDTLKHYFFNIGNSYYGSDEFRKANPTYEAIGKFGIGFLACFMLSKTVVLETQCMEHERIHINFEKDSPFVIKRECEKCFLEGHGTRIILNYHEVIGPIFKNVEALRNYLRELLLTDDYVLKIVNNNKEEHINTSLRVEKNTKLHYISNDDFDIYYSFLLKPQITTSYTELKNDINEVWYYYHKKSYKDGSGCNLFSLVEVESLYEYHSQSFAELLLETILGIECTDSNINYSVIEPRLLEMLYKNGTISYWKVPYLEHRTDVERFMEKIENDEYEKVLQEYNNRLKYFYICGKDLQLNDFKDISLEKLADRVISIEEDDAAYYWQEGYVPYPFKPKRVVLQARKERKNCGCWIFESEAKDLSGLAKIYMHGIRVNDSKLGFPNYVKNMAFDHLVINVKTNDYSLNVARNRFEKDSERRIGEQISKLVYEDILCWKELGWSKAEQEEFIKIMRSIYLSWRA